MGTTDAPAPRPRPGREELEAALDAWVLVFGGISDDPNEAMSRLMGSYNTKVDELARETKRAEGHERAWQTLRSILNLPAEPVDGGRDVLDAINALLWARDEGPKAACVGVTVVIRDGSRVLLGRKGRAFDQSFVGLWVTPGGRVAFGESLAEAAVRETQEETGLTVRLVRSLPPAQLIHEQGHYVFAVYEAVPVAGELRAGDDLTEVRWFEPHELPDTTAVTKAAVHAAFELAEVESRLRQQLAEAHQQLEILRERVETLAGGHRSQPPASSPSGARGGKASRSAPAGQDKGKVDPVDHDPDRCRKLACPCKVARR